MTLKEKFTQTVLGKTDGKRDPSLDNIRFILILLVVFAHLLEICRPFIETGIDYGGGLIYGSGVIYKTIYSFHMPLFVFLFGCNVRFSPKRIFFRWVIPYAVFQTLYTVFAVHVLQDQLRIQYTTPYWLLWYMLACIFYQLILPLIDVGSKRGEIAVLVLSFAAALFMGYDKTVGYYLSLSRFWVFLPWFVMGYYCRKHAILEKMQSKTLLRRIVTAVSAVMAAVSVVYMYHAYPKNLLLYGSAPYADIGCSAWLRVWVFLLAFSWLCLLFVGIRPLLRRNLFLITMIGQNTWPIFLAHGFAVKIAPIWFEDLLQTPAGVLLYTCGILIIAGNPLFRRIVDGISLSWLEKIAEKLLCDRKV